MDVKQHGEERYVIIKRPKFALAKCLLTLFNKKQKEAVLELVWVKSLAKSSRTVILVIIGGKGDFDVKEQVVLDDCESTEKKDE